VPSEPHTRPPGFALALCAAALCACRSSVPGSSTREAESQAVGAASVVTVTATDYAFDAPQTVPAGWTTFQFVNHGTQLHAAQLVRLEDGHTLAEFVTAYEHAWRTVGPRPRWGIRSGGPGAVEARGSSNATMYLEPGNYAWYCPMNIEDGIPHIFSKGMARPFVVQPRTAAGPQTAPQATVLIRLSEYAFNPSTSLTAGHRILKLENVGTEPHELGIVRLDPGKKLEDFLAWAKDFHGPPPGTVVGGINSLAPGVAGYFEVDLIPGEYVLLCFVTAPDGRPHVDHGMIQGITVG
jgi:plastocyanin